MQTKDRETLVIGVTDLGEGYVKVKLDDIFKYRDNAVENALSQLRTEIEESREKFVKSYQTSPVNTYAQDHYYNGVLDAHNGLLNLPSLQEK